MKNVDDMNKKDWQKILDKRIIDIAELEKLNESGELGKGYEQVENYFNESDDEGCAYCEDVLDYDTDANMYQYTHEHGNEEYLCNKACSYGHQRSRLMSFKITLGQLEKLAKGEEV
jgi:hypothetical protein